MEKKFKNLLKLSADYQNLQNLAAPSFEMDLFRQSNWFLGMNDIDKNLEVVKVDVNESQSIVEFNTSISTPETLINFSKLKVLFVGDSYLGEGEDLLAKMIYAMTLSSIEFKRIPFNTDLENIEEFENISAQAFLDLINIIENEAPLFVVSLGATVTNLLLSRREKMSGIHGKYFKLKANAWEYQLMPLFHPDFLQINPNMKRTAWIDLQKIMSSLGKN